VSGSELVVSSKLDGLDEPGFDSRVESLEKRKRKVSEMIRYASECGKTTHSPVRVLEVYIQ